MYNKTFPSTDICYLIHLNFRKHSNRKPQPEISVLAEVDDEIVDEPTPGPSVTNIPASQPTETEEALRCMLSGCPSYTHLFSTNKTYEKHLRQVIRFQKLFSLVLVTTQPSH